MSYREPAAKEEKPLEWLIVQERFWHFYLLITVVTLFNASLFAGTVHLECTRSAPREPAQCSASSWNLYAREAVGPFTLTPGSIHVGEKVSRRRTKYPTLVTPNGTLEGPAVGKEFVQRVEGEAERFREDTIAVAWQAGQTAWIPSAILLLIGTSVIVAIITKKSPRKLLIDPNERTFTAGKRTWSLDDIDDVYASSSGRGSYSLDLKVNGIPVTITNGTEASVKAAREAIERAIAERP